MARLAEDAAIMDKLSGGRLELGVPVGSAAVSERDGLSAVLEARSPGLAARLWCTAAREADARAVGAAGNALLLACSAKPGPRAVGEVQLPLVQAYCGHFRPGAHPAPRVAALRTITPFTSPADPRRAMAIGTRHWARRILPDIRWLKRPLDDMPEQHDIYTGVPDAIVTALQRDKALAHATDLLVQLQPATLDFASAVRALATMAMEIAPALGWRAGMHTGAEQDVSSLRNLRPHAQPQAAQRAVAF